MQHYAISASRDGFRRAGRAWTRAATVVAADDITEAQLEQLRADPNITVTETAAPEAAPSVAAAAPEDVATLRGLLIRAAMRGLDPDNPDHFTKAGLPEVAALKQATGLESVSAAERSELWDAEQAEG